ncbi:hypothetical protein QOT17_010363 [Balamuthia mandrillaris]
MARWQGEQEYYLEGLTVIHLRTCFDIACAARRSQQQCVAVESNATAGVPPPLTIPSRKQQLIEVILQFTAATTALVTNAAQRLCWLDDQPLHVLLAFCKKERLLVPEEALQSTDEVREAVRAYLLSSEVQAIVNIMTFSNRKAGSTTTTTTQREGEEEEGEESDEEEKDVDTASNWEEARKQHKDRLTAMCIARGLAVSNTKRVMAKRILSYDRKHIQHCIRFQFLSLEQVYKMCRELQIDTDGATNRGEIERRLVQAWQQRGVIGRNADPTMHEHEEDEKGKGTEGYECRICMEDGVEVERMVMVLPCRHSMCEKCARGVAAVRRRACPFCNQRMVRVWPVRFKDALATTVSTL